MIIRGFYFITDASLSRSGVLADVKSALSAGVKIIQYRGKNTSGRLMYVQALAIRRLCKKAVFIVNDRVDIALAVSADGVHLGQDDLPIEAARRILGPQKIVGFTAHNLQEALSANRKGADYIGVAPVFATKTKLDAGRPCGVDLIRKVKKALSIPVVAIGGINLANAPLVIEAGADALCAIGATVASKNVKKEIERFQILFGE